MKRGITFGAFDLCHAGHALMFEYAKRHCDFLIVGLHVDPSIERPTKNKPIQSLYERYIQLRAIGFIDEIIPYSYEVEVEEMLLTLDLDCRFIGEDYKDLDFTGKELCEEHKIQLIYTPRKHKFSSSELRRRLENSNNG